MALTTTKDTAQIGQGGGGIAYAMEVTSAGAALGTPDSFHSLGYLKSTSISDLTEVSEEYDESGAMVAQLYKPRTIKLKWELMQRSKAVHLALTSDARSKYYRIYYQTSAQQGGKVVEYVFGICRIAPKLELKYENSNMTVVPCEISVLNNSAIISIANNTLPTEKKTSNAMDIAANAIYSVEET